jgi:cell division protein ZapB
MDTQLLDALEERIATLLNEHRLLKQENLSLKEENTRLAEEREGIKGRIDQIIKKLEGI